MRASTKEANVRLALVSEGNFPNCPLVGERIGDADEIEVGDFGDWECGRSGVCHAQRIGQEPTRRKTFLHVFAIFFEGRVFLKVLEC